MTRRSPEVVRPAVCYGTRGRLGRHAVRCTALWTCLLWGVVGLLTGLQAQALEVGQAAPAFRAHLETGQELTLAQEQGKVVLIHFWATWCIPCRTEMPAMERYYQRHRAQGLEILTVSMDEADDLPRMRQMMTHYSYPALWYPQADFKAFGRIWRIPLSFVIDRQGILRQDAWDGGDEGLDEAVLERVVTPLLTQP